jgi:hypothetical protein
MANNQLLASDTFASGSLAAGWSAIFTQVVSQIAGSPFAAEPPSTIAAGRQYWSGLVWPNDQSSEVTVNLTNENGTTVDLWVRVQSGAYSGYVVSIGNSIATLYRCTAGAFTQIDQIGSLVFANGDVWVLQAAGAVLSIYQNWKKVMWFYDTTYTSGSPGFSQNTTINVTHSRVLSWRGYSMVQQDGIWTKQSIVLPALAVDISATFSAGTYQLSNILTEGNAQLLSGTVLKAWFSGGSNGGNTANIYYAESPATDGINWTRRSAAVITGMANPFVIKNGSTYYLYCQTGATQGVTPMFLFTSADGVTWAQQSSNILSAGGAGAWDTSAFYDFQPVAIISGTWYALYTGYNGGNFLSTGLATSPDGLIWTKYVGNPVLPNVANTGAFAQVGNTYYLWGGTAQPGQYVGALNGFRPAEVVRYQTTDFIHWTNPVHSAHHSQMHEALNFNAASSPGGAFPNAIANVNGKAYLYIQETPADGSNPDVQQISVATGPASIASIAARNEDAVLQVASDAFTSGIGNLSASWTTIANFTKLQIVAGNLVEALTLGTVAGMYYSGASFSSNHYSEITIRTLVSVASIAEPCVRCQPNGNLYNVTLDGPTGSVNPAIQISKFIGGVTTAIGPAVGMTPSLGDVIRMSVVTGYDGNPVLSIYQNGFLLLQVQDYSNAIPSGGAPGLLVVQSGGSLANAQVSAWAGGNANVIPNYSTQPVVYWL